MTSESEGPRPPERPQEPAGDVVEGQYRVLEGGPGGAGLPPQPPPFPTFADQSFLRNRFVIAGIAVAGAIVLAVFVVILFGGGGEGSGKDDGVQVQPLTPLAGRGIKGRSIATATVREGPSAEYPELGILRNSRDVEVVGRNAEGTWYVIYFPPGTSLSGWVPASALRVPEEAAQLPIATVTPISRPTVIQPTAAPEPTETASPTPTVTGTPTPSGGPDLAISIVPPTCAPGSRLLVNIKNVGTVPLVNRSLTVRVQTPDGAQLDLVNSAPVTIQPGQSVDVQTNYTVAARVVIIVDPFNQLGDPRLDNNRVDCVVSVSPSPATPTRTPTAGATLTPTP